MEPIKNVIHPFLNKIGRADPAEVTWECETCGTVEPYHLKSNGRYVRARCPCQKEAEERNERAMRHMSYLQEQMQYTYGWLGTHWTDFPLKEKTFETFQKDMQLDAYELCRSFALEPEGSLILHGTFGTGKTHLLAAVCNELRMRWFSSRFTTAPKLFRAIQERIYHHEDYYDLIHKACTAPLLVIDDIDKAKPSEFREEVYFEIIDERVKAELPLALSTNRLSDLALYVGEAGRSRLSYKQIAIEMDGADYRMRL